MAECISTGSSTRPLSGPGPGSDRGTAPGLDGEPPRVVPVTGDGDLAALVVLAGLANLTPRRFWRLIGSMTPVEALQRVRSGQAPRAAREHDMAAAWREAVVDVDAAAVLQRHRAAGVQVLAHGVPGYPTRLINDPEPPVVVFARGGLPDDHMPMVAVVGTRRCTAYGRSVSGEVGAVCASHGIGVVSGLAHGIDAAAHVGVCRQTGGVPVGVLANGVDVVYPRANAELFTRVAGTGVLLSEWPMGARGTRWRFPARNRLIAALADAVVVVESAAKGGSMYTVDAALERDIPVFAVPGPITSAASTGTNRLIADGAAPMCVATDLFDVVRPRLNPAEVAGARRRPQTDGEVVVSWLLDEIDFVPTLLERVVEACGRPLLDVTLELERLMAAGVVRRSGGVVERLR